MFEFFFLALGLGIKHSFDADHLVAVSNLLTRARSLWDSAKMALSWAAGHMLTAALVTVLLFVFKDSLLAGVLAHLELLVALMLIVLGVLSLYQARLFHSHPHVHPEKRHVHPHLHLPQRSNHTHLHMFGIGIVHGLASNDELLLLLTLSLGLSSLADMIVGVGIFSIGVVLGMLAFSLFLTLPLLRIHSEKITRAINAIVGAASVLYGLFLFIAVI